MERLPPTLLYTLILENYLSDPFYSLPPPKSLDVNDFSLGQIRGLSTEDSICTLTDVTARTVVDSLSFFKKKPELKSYYEEIKTSDQRIKYLKPSDELIEMIIKLMEIL